MNIRFVLLTPNDMGSTVACLNMAIKEVHRDGVPCLRQVKTGSNSKVAVVTEKEVSQEDAQHIYDNYIDEPSATNPHTKVNDIKWPDPLGPIRLPDEENYPLFRDIVENI